MKNIKKLALAIALTGFTAAYVPQVFAGFCGDACLGQDQVTFTNNTNTYLFVYVNGVRSALAPGAVSSIQGPCTSVSFQLHNAVTGVSSQMYSYWNTSIRCPQSKTQQTLPTPAFPAYDVQWLSSSSECTTNGLPICGTNNFYNVKVGKNPNKPPKN